MTSDMEDVRMMFHFGFPAYFICATAHETNSILGLLLGSVDVLRNMAAQNPWAEPSYNPPSLGPCSAAALFLQMSVHATLHTSCSLFHISGLHRK